MAGKELIVDDDFFNYIGSTFVSRGDRADLFIRYYLFVLRSIKSDGLIEGEAANALDMFIECAKVLEDTIGNISGLANRRINNYLAEVDHADRYLF